MYKKLCIKTDAKIADALQILDENPQKICLVVDKNRLLGTITDGDIRRGLLRGIPFTDAAQKVMNSSPYTVSDDTNRVKVREFMTSKQLLYMPTVDENGKLTGIITLTDLVPIDKPHNNWVILMAGGLGERLRPLTKNTPKPLIKIGNKPLLQSILENFIEQKFDQFYISVNYQADAIKKQFGDGSSWGVNIKYLEEKKRMGTAGAISLLPDVPSDPIIVMNGDLVTRTSFKDLLEFHSEQKSQATMCVREYDVQVPFGVVNIDSHRIQSINEKPLHRFFVNAGIYVLDSSVVSLIPKDTHYDMTQVFEHVISRGDETAAFPIHEYWLDIGRMDDLAQAESDFKKDQNL